MAIKHILKKTKTLKNKPFFGIINMQNKYLLFGKNAVLAGIAGLAAGAGIAEFSHYITDSKTLTSITSTIASYAAMSGVFLPLHAKDNSDIYYDKNNKFKWRDFIWDQLKMMGGFVVLDIAYLAGKPFVVNELMKNGSSPSHSSLYTDLMSAGVFLLAAFPIAKLTGNIRPKNPTLEEKISESETVAKAE